MHKNKKTENNRGCQYLYNKEMKRFYLLDNVAKTFLLF